MWRVHKEAGRPWPVLCKDDVIDYMVMEAVAMKVDREDAEAAKQQKVREDRKDVSGLKQYQ
jgi:hypothetical protein